MVRLNNEGAQTVVILSLALVDALLALKHHVVPTDSACGRVEFM